MSVVPGGSRCRRGTARAVVVPLPRGSMRVPMAGGISVLLHLGALGALFMFAPAQQPAPANLGVVEAILGSELAQLAEAAAPETAPSTPSEQAVPATPPEPVRAAEPPSLVAEAGPDTIAAVPPEPLARSPEPEAAQAAPPEATPAPSAEPQAVTAEEPPPPPPPSPPPRPVQPRRAPRLPVARAPASAAPEAPAAPTAPPAANAQTALPGWPDAVPNWQGQILARLQHARRYPESSRARREEGVVLLSFSLDRDGRVLAASIARSSGFPELDAETLELIRRAAPLPAPPPELPGAVVALRVPIRFNLQ